MTQIETVTVERPYRCSVCRRVKPAGSEMTYISGGSVWCWRQDTWEEIVRLTEASSMRTGVCSTCISLKRAESAVRSVVPETGTLRALRLVPPVLLIAMGVAAGAAVAVLLL